MTRQQPRGYALLIVMVAGIVLAALSVAMITATGVERRGNRVQMNSMRALYAAESAVAFAVDEVGNRLEGSVDPSFTGISAPSMPDIDFPTFELSYVDPNNGFINTGICGDDSDCTGGITGACSSQGVCRFSSVEILTEGDYAGLTALQTPIQVLVTARVRSSLATVGDVLKLNLIPIFQFGLFFDGDLEFQNPPGMTIGGPVHTNAGFYPIRTSGSTLAFLGRITIAGYQYRCALYDNGACFTSGDTGVVVDGDALDEGREDNGTDALQAAFHGQAKYSGKIKDQASGAGRLNPPIPISVTRPDVTSRPDTCGNLTAAGSASFEQGVGVHIVRRPDELVNSINYPTMPPAARMYTEAYGPSGSNTDLAGGGEPWDSNPCAGNGSRQPHCQSVTDKVPVIVHTQSQDNQAVAGERMYWKAHIRIIDGIWYDRSNNVIFNPETWNLNVAAGSAAVASASAHVQRGHAYARVLRYGWFWDPRENRVYDSTYDGSFSSTTYHRGLQMRTTDFDMYAFHQLLQDSTAVGQIFEGGGIPNEGIILYISETFDPSYEDRNTTTERKTNVRNFLNFHGINDDAAAAGECLLRAQSVADPTAANYTPCELGWHPHYLWGGGAQAMVGGNDWPHSIQIPPVAATTTDLQFANGIPEVPTPNTGFTASPNCYNPIGRTAPVYDPDDPLPPCQLSVPRPSGPENAIRMMRMQKMPRVGGDPAPGLTVSTDNRVYLYGDVNVNSSGNQDVDGKVAFIVDSITILSQAFSDFIMQRGAMDDDTIHASPSYYAGPFQQGVPASMQQATPVAFNGGGGPFVFGDAPNLCNAWNDNGGFARRKAIDVKIHASLMMGDVPSCDDAEVVRGDGARSGGVNNFPRFLENMSGDTVTIRGSIVSLFRAEQGNSRWITAHNDGSASEDQWAQAIDTDPKNSSYDNDQNRGCVYSPPVRDWGFDPALANPDNLPPGTPRLVDVSRVRWVRR